MEFNSSSNSSSNSSNNNSSSNTFIQTNSCNISSNNNSNSRIWISFSIQLLPAWTSKIPTAITVTTKTIWNSSSNNSNSSNSNNNNRNNTILLITIHLISLSKGNNSNTDQMTLMQIRPNPSARLPSRTTTQTPSPTTLPNSSNSNSSTLVPFNTTANRSKALNSRTTNNRPVPAMAKSWASSTQVAKAVLNTAVLNPSRTLLPITSSWTRETPNATGWRSSSDPKLKRMDSNSKLLLEARPILTSSIQMMKRSLRELGHGLESLLPQRLCLGLMRLRNLLMIMCLRLEIARIIMEGRIRGMRMKCLGEQELGQGWLVRCCLESSWIHQPNLQISSWILDLVKEKEALTLKRRRTRVRFRNRRTNKTLIRLWRTSLKG